LDENWDLRAEADIFDLVDKLNWNHMFPGLPTVEVARQQENPRFWFRAQGQQGEEFYVAGYSVNLCGTRLFSSSSFCTRDGLPFGEYAEKRFYGLSVHHSRREAEWRELFRDLPKPEDPAELFFEVDVEWPSQPVCDVLKKLSGYTFISSEVGPPLQQTSEVPKQDDRHRSPEESPDPQRRGHRIKRSL
jgi:hypothetical protein